MCARYAASCSADRGAGQAGGHGASPRANHRSGCGANQRSRRRADHGCGGKTSADNSPRCRTGRGHAEARR